MKTKEILIKIFVVFSFVIIISIAVLGLLGIKERAGFLSDFNLNIDKTLYINGLDINETKKLFTLDDKLDYNSITNYIFTNNSITNYSYDFRIKYYSKIFRNSDIYDVYPHLNNLPEYIKSATMADNYGTPFGNLISDKIIGFDKIDGVSYILKLKSNFTFIYLLLLIILLICIFCINNFIIKIKVIFQKNNIFILKICSTIIFILIVLTIILSFLGKKDRVGYLSEFKINVDKTLELNGLGNTKQLFTIDDKLNYDSITNYIFTNNSITNYSYDFRIKYYSKIFRNSDIYNVYPHLNNLPEYIKSATMADNYGTPFGSFISTSILNYYDKIDITYYLMVNLNIFFCIAIIFIIALFFLSFYFIKKYLEYKIKLDRKDFIFISILELFYCILIIFKIWLLYPGEYLITDTLHIITYLGLGNVANDHHPVIIELVIRLISKLGLTLGEVFVINTIIFYLSFYIVTIAIYLKYKNKKIIFLFLITFIAPIFFNSIVYLKGLIAIIYVFFSYSLVFFISLVEVNKRDKNILKIVSIIFLIIGMLHRHNFIVTVYPIFIWFSYDFLKSKNLKTTKKYILSFVAMMFINAILLISVHYVFPRMFCYHISHNQVPSVLYIQTVETLLNAKDDNLIPPDMYKENKSFEDIKKFKTSYQNDLYSYYRLLWNETYINMKPNLKKQKEILFDTILKYPFYYLEFLFNFAKNIYTLEYKTDSELRDICQKDYNYMYDSYNQYFALGAEKSEFYRKFRDENRGINFTELKSNIFIFLRQALPSPNIFIFVLLSFMLFIISGILLLLKNNLKNDMLVLSFSLAFSSSATAIIIVIFGNFNGYRLIYPTMPISIMSLIAFILFIYDLGGLKNFFIKLKN